MANIKVFNQVSGKWSKSIQGVDREFFVKSVIESRLEVHKLNTHGKKSNEVVRLSKIFEKLSGCCMKNIELDFNKIIYGDILDLRYSFYEDFVDDCDGKIVTVERRTDEYDKATHVETLVSYDKVNLNPNALFISVGRLKELTEYFETYSLFYWIPLIEKIIEMGDIPSDASDDYTLILKFE